MNPQFENFLKQCFANENENMQRTRLKVLERERDRRGL